MGASLPQKLRQTTGGNSPSATPRQRCQLKPISLLETRGGSTPALAAAAIWLAGFSTYRKGFSALLQGRLNINALMTVAVTGAFLIGQWPEAAMVMALYAIAELIEGRAVDRARTAPSGSFEKMDTFEPM